MQQAGRRLQQAEQLVLFAPMLLSHQSRPMCQYRPLFQRGDLGAKGLEIGFGSGHGRGLGRLQGVRVENKQRTHESGFGVNLRIFSLARRDDQGPFAFATLPLSSRARNEGNRMFEALRSIFQRPDATVLSMEPKLATAALLVHLAAIDGSISTDERTALTGALMDYYSLSQAEVEKL
ncbi:MAG: hypothetical protein EON57_04615, partial [Alphaproteobacteria bacterium]